MTKYILVELLVKTTFKERMPSIKILELRILKKLK